MLYPEFEELISYRGLKWSVAPSSRCLTQAAWLGGYHSPFRGIGLEFDSVRKYVPGDDIRNIDWRVTARTGAPHLKIFGEERQREVFLCIDSNVGMRFGTRGTFKSVQAARIASILGWQGLAHQDRISACLFGDVSGGIEFFTPQQSKMSFSRLLKRLCEVESESKQVSLANAFQQISQVVHPGALVYFISDFMDLECLKERETYLSNLSQKCDVIFIAVNDPSDRMLMPVGSLCACSETAETFTVNTDSEVGRDLYAQQWWENREYLTQITSKFGISLVELTTESDVTKDLWLALKKLSHRGRR